MSDLENQDSSSQTPNALSSQTDSAKDAPAGSDATGASPSKPDDLSAAAAGPAPKPQSTAMTILPPRRDSFRNKREDRIGGAPESEPTSGMFLKAAAVLVVLGATGAMAVAGANYFHGDATKDATQSAKEAVVAAENTSLKQTIARLDSEVATLRANLDQFAKANSSQIGRINDRVDRVEKAQAEPNARLAKLTEAVDKLKAPATPAPATNTAASNAATNVASNVTASSTDPTGSVPAATNTSVAAAAAPAVKKPPIIDGWVLRHVTDGGALIEGPFGLFDVYPGDPLPGLNRVEAIRRDGGRWVVVTRKGLIVSR